MRSAAQTPALPRRPGSRFRGTARVHSTIDASQFMKLALADRQAAIMALSDEEAESLLYDWRFWARPSQLLPQGDWTYWFLKAGRGFGKTRVGAETVREWATSGDYHYVNLVGATTDDAREIMIEGESGILSICPRHERPDYVPSKRRLEWPNGSRSLIFTADEPERMRGKQHQKVWADEIGAWRYADAWDQLVLGLRLGPDPQAVITSTPRSTKAVRDLLKLKGVRVTHGTTYENRENLAAAFYDVVIKKYEGTRLGRQELMAELLDDNPNALWTRKNLDDHRRAASNVPALKRFIVGVDPSVTSKRTSNEAGIVGAGVGSDDRIYVFDDRTLLGTPDEWASAAVKLYHERKADRLVAEVNNGGDLVEAVIRTVDPDVSYKDVRASRGKYTRAEPVAALYEQGRVSHVGDLAMLEDEMCEYDPLTSTQSPNRMDALVWAITELMTGRKDWAWDLY